jgi:hypothetical protein
MAEIRTRSQMHLGAAMVAAMTGDKAKGKAKVIKEEPNLAPAYKAKFQHVIEGKFLKTLGSRSQSEVSVQA